MNAHTTERRERETAAKDYFVGRRVTDIANILLFFDIIHDLEV